MKSAFEVRDMFGRRIYRCASKKGVKVQAHLAELLPVGSFSVTSLGVQLNCELESLGFESTTAFAFCCAHHTFPTVPAHGFDAGAQLDVRRDIASARGDDILDIFVVRDQNGCFLGCSGLEEAKSSWGESNLSIPTGGQSTRIIEVELTVSIDRARRAIESSQPASSVAGCAQYRKSIEKALSRPYLAGVQQDTQGYWRSQSGVLWSVIDRSSAPICRIPYDMIGWFFGNQWFCSEPNTAQIATVRPKKENLARARRALSVTEAFYNHNGDAGSACRARLTSRGEAPDAYEYANWAHEVWTGVFRNDVARVSDAEGHLLGFYKLEGINRRFHPTVSNGHVVAATIEAKVNARTRRHGLRKLMRAEYASEEMREEMLEALGDDEPLLRVSTASGGLVGYYPETRVWRRWNVESISQTDEATIPDQLSKADRLRLLRLSKRQRRKLLDYQTREVDNEIADVIESLRVSDDDNGRRRGGTGAPCDVDALLSVALRHIAKQGRDTRTRDEVERVLKRRIQDGKTSVIAMRVRRELAAQKRKSVIVDGTHMEPDDLVGRALSLHRGAIAQMAELLADDIERETNGETSVVEPAWTRAHRDYLFGWADRTLASSDGLRDQPAALYLAHSIRSGKVDVLVFDAELYEDVTHADMSGSVEHDEESFPYPTCVVTLRDERNVYGVAVCNASAVYEFAASEHLEFNQGSGLHTFFIGDGAGEANAEQRTRAVAERLVTYLECDNANVETIYVRAGQMAGRRKASSKAGTQNLDYRAGANLIVGARVVPEQRQEKRRTGERQARRAHFRRGHYSRYRIGPRGNWHYEKRWVKPTFVHGYGQAVTEHKVRRIVI